MRYQPDSKHLAQLVYDLPNDLSLWRGSLRGVQAAISNDQVRYSSPIRFVLPLAADVRVSVDGQEVQHQILPPGTVTLPSLPLRQNQGSIVIEIEDDTGQRSVSQPYNFSAALYAPGSYSAQVEGGLLTQQLYVGAAGKYGLNSSITLEGQAGYKAGEVQAQAWVLFAPPNQFVRLGASVSATNQRFDASLMGQYSFYANPFSVSLGAEVPLDFQKSNVNLAVRYASGRFSVGVLGGYSSAINGFYGGLDGNIRLNESFTLVSSASVDARSTRLGLTVSWNPRPGLQAQVGTSYPLGGEPTFGASVGAQLNPYSKVAASTDFQSLSAAYQYRKQFGLDVGASTQGDVSAQLSGRATLVSGQVSFGAQSGSNRFILLKTGVPNIGIYAEGRYQGKTNAQGDVVLSADSSSGTQIRVDLSSLPIEVSLESAVQVVMLPTAGAVVVDWRSNFQQSRFVTFGRDAKHPASGGEVAWEGQDSIYLDDFGEGLLPVLDQAVSGTLTFEDGTQCAVTIAAATPVYCQTKP